MPVVSAFGRKLKPGSYRVRVIAKGFTVSQRENVRIEGSVSLDVQLTIEAEKQVVNVESEANNVSTDPTQNGGAKRWRRTSEPCGGADE